MLIRFLELVPSIRFVVLHGGDAQLGWKRLTRAHRGIARRYRVWAMFHTSNRAFAGNVDRDTRPGEYSDGLLEVD